MRTIHGLILLGALLLGGCTPAVSGRVFFDTEGTGKAAVSEEGPGIGSVPVELYLVESYLAKSELKPIAPPAATPPVDNGKAAAVATSPAATGQLVASQKTDGEGRFQFGDLEPGKYEVRLADDVWTQGYRLTTQKNPINVTTAFRPAKVRFGLRRDGLQKMGGTCPETVMFPDAALCEQQYKNDSPIDMTQVVIAVTMDDILAAIPRHGGHYLPTKHKVLWVFPVIKPYETVTVGFVMVPQLPATTVAQVSLHWVIENPQTQQTMELGTVNTSITTTAEAVITIAGPTTVAKGESATFTIKLRNAGTRPLTDVMVECALPPEVIHEKSSHQGTYDDNARRVTWTIDTLAVGAQSERLVKVTHAADAAAAAFSYDVHVTSAEIVEPITASHTVQPSSSD